MGCNYRTSAAQGFDNRVWAALGIAWQSQQIRSREPLGYFLRGTSIREDDSVFYCKVSRFVSQLFTVRSVADVRQAQISAAICQRSECFEQFQDALPGIQAPHEQHKFGLIVYAQLNARRAAIG